MGVMMLTWLSNQVNAPNGASWVSGIGMGRVHARMKKNPQ